MERLQVHGFDNVGHGTIYPLTTRLRKSGLVDQELIPATALISGRGGSTTRTRTDAT